ncbi:hypothetical protein [Kitasatospora sp. GP82]|uniref:hypothetical protein n=1 Tax=Kitasatospora sp. GP82 TaxID=3035089 RepID=UPI002474F75F|nr:hypothetical protein [Kitasatospora sp. GP82]MDH6129379.1 hypothetical protein [Kitasatospora sp. GP82]
MSITSLLNGIGGILPSQQWLVAHSDILAGAVVAAATAVLLLRRWRQAERDYQEEQQLSAKDIAERKLHIDARGRRLEDIWTVLVASAAAGLSATGLRKMGRDMMGLTAPWDWLPFIALDVAAYVCGMRARRRSRNGEPPGLSGVLVWVFALISSSFSASEGANFGEAISRAPWSIIAAVLFELGSLEERTAARELARRAGEWLDRRMRMVRMLHPIEWIKVALALAADETLSQADATRRVRIQTAASKLYRVRLLDGARDGQTKAKSTGWQARGLARAIRRAQQAQTRVALADQIHILAHLERLVRTPDTAAVDFTKRQAVKAVLATFVADPASTADSGSGLYPGAGTAPDAVAGHQAGVPGYGPGAGEAYPLSAGVHSGTPGAGTGAPQSVYSGTADRTRQPAQVYSGTGEAGTGTAQAPYPGTADRTRQLSETYPGTPGAGTGTPLPPYPSTVRPSPQAPASSVPVENPQVNPGTPFLGAGTAVLHAGTSASDAGTRPPASGTPGVFGNVAEDEHGYVPGFDSAYEGETGTAAEHAGTGSDPDPDEAGTDETGDRDDLTLARMLLPYVGEDGKVSLSIRDVRKLLQAGQKVARRVMELAPTLLDSPEPEPGLGEPAETAPATGCAAHSAQPASVSGPRPKELVDAA